jgi:hypothetical protein
MREKTTVHFKIHSAKLTAQEIAARIGIEPDESWKAGDQRGPFGTREKLHGFVLESKLPPHGTLDEHVKAMLKRVAPSAQKIGALVADATIEFVCTIHRNIGPALRFERDDVRWLGVMGARLDVDVFILRDNAPAKAAPPPPPTTGQR